MRAVLFVFIAEQLQYVAVRNQELSDLYREGLEVHLGVVNGHLQVHMAKIEAVKKLLNPHCLAMRMSGGIQPALVIESRPIHHPRISLPFPHPLPPPPRLRISG